MAGLQGGATAATALAGDVGDKTLDLGRLGVSLNLTADHVLAHVVLLRQVEQLADVHGTLGPKTAGHLLVGHSLELVLALLHNDQVEHGDVASHDASTHGLPVALSRASTPRLVADLTTGQEQLDTAVGEDSLLHGESLLVRSSGDTEDVSLVLVSEEGALELLWGGGGVCMMCYVFSRWVFSTKLFVSLDKKNVCIAKCNAKKVTHSKVVRTQGNTDSNFIGLKVRKSATSGGK